MTKTKFLLIALNLGIIASISSTSVQAKSIVVDSSGKITIKPNILGLSSKSTTKSESSVKVEKVETKAAEVEVEATQENTVRLSTKPTKSTVATPLAEETEVIFLQKVATSEAKTKIVARDNEKYMITNKVSAKVNTPLSFNLETNQMTVTTPAGTKVVAILPDAALAKAKVETSEADSHIELIDYQNSPTYAINGKSNQKLLGLFPISLQKTVYISAVSGNTVKTNQNLVDQFIDLLSF